MPIIAIMYGPTMMPEHHTALYYITGDDDAAEREIEELSHEPNIGPGCGFSYKIMDDKETWQAEGAELPDLE
ncbi:MULTISPECIES: hypothetical protein [Lichenihabitans]|uniref:hypothetical protein n=1 Tax=Lichenihabitans TaxID=2723776 RepID=UPI001036F138|nr:MULTISPECIES: hypothetical protein [Lichenihabitans]UDL95541.1 hypothetical protein LGH83_04790 [Lichenihabitans sp. PAMC28606]